MDYSLTGHLSVTGGFRYTWDKARYERALSYIGDYNYRPLFYTITDPAHYGSPLPTLHGANSAPTGRAALTYTFDNRSIVYASYNHGYRAGTFSGGAYQSVAQLDFVKPETVDAWELGTKGRLFGGKLTYALNGFYMSYHNQQTQETIGFTPFLRNAGKATIYGAEAELTAKPASGLLLHGSVGYLHTRYDQLLLGKDATTGNPGVDLAGNQLPFAPEVSLQFGADWDVAQIGGGQLTFSPQVSYSSKQWFTPYNGRESFPGDTVKNGALSQKGYALVDGSLTWKSKNLKVNAWVRNLLDKQYNVYGLYLRSTFGADVAIPADPRTFGLTLRVDY